MNYEQLIEELREEMLQLVNTKCDALLQMYRSGEVHTNVKDTIRESSLITVSPAELKGKRPLAVQFAPGEWIETPTWRKVDEELYFEGKFDTEAMLNMLEKKVLEPAGVDYSSIKIRYMAKGQEQAKNIEQDVLEHEEQEQHAPVQTM